MRVYRWLTLGAAVLITAFAAVIFLAASSTVHAASPPVCDMRLDVVLTPDVPDPRETGFLSSLLSNHPNYQLTLLEEDPGSFVVLHLSGPGPEYRCEDVIDTMRRDGRVLSVDAEPDTREASDDTQSVPVTAPLPAEETNVHLSLAGLGSLVWATGNPAQAWKILAPIEPDGIAYADITAKCNVATAASNSEAACP